MKIKMTKKYYIILTVTALAVAGFFLINNGEEEESFARVEKGNLVQEIFETGSTEKGENVKLSFKEGGKIKDVLVGEGETVKKGEALATLDRRELELSLKEAEAALASTEASLERFLIGSTKEEVEVAEAAVRSAETSLVSAENNLREQEKIAEESLKNAHQGTAVLLGTKALLGDVYSTANEIKIGVVDIADSYFTGMVVKETTSGRRSRDAIRRIVKAIEDHKDMASREDVDYKEKEDALKKAKEELKKLVNELDNLVDVSESDFYKDRFTDTDKSLLRGYRVTANNKLNEVRGLLRNISSVKAEIEATLTSARGSVDSAKAVLQQREKDLARIEAGPEPADVHIKEAAVNQAQARADLLKNRIEDTVLRSPVKGIVSSLLARGGEVVSPGNLVFVIVPEEEMQIATDIYEGDIAKVNVGNEVRASFVAFPGREFKGTIVFINPTGKTVDGVIYYSVKIALDEYPKEVLSQMTVDVTIITEEKEDVLFIPERAVRRKEGKQMVTVFENGEKVEREIMTGIRGEGRLIEVISGLEEGEKIFTE